MISIALLFSISDQRIYLLASCFFKYAWTFTLPYLLACMTGIDTSGRLIVTTNLVIGGGLAAGPAVAALTLRAGSNFDRILILGICCALSACLRMLPLARSKTEQQVRSEVLEEV